MKKFSDPKVGGSLFKKVKVGGSLLTTPKMVTQNNFLNKRANDPILSQEILFLFLFEFPTGLGSWNWVYIWTSWEREKVHFSKKKMSKIMNFNISKKIYIKNKYCRILALYRGNHFLCLKIFGNFFLKISIKITEDKKQCMKKMIKKMMLLVFGHSNKLLTS